MAFRDVIDFYEESDRNRADVLNEPLEYLLQNDIFLKELAESLQVDLETLSNSLANDYTKTDALNELLANGVKGDKGDTGVGLEYNWDGTSLGVKREDETDYSYVNLQGPAGNAGLEETEIQEMIDQAVSGIIVPNKVSQLENDEGFITIDDVTQVENVELASGIDLDTLIGFNKRWITKSNAVSKACTNTPVNNVSSFELYCKECVSGNTTYLAQILTTYKGDCYIRSLDNGVFGSWNLFLKSSDVINNLTSTTTDKPLSAYQGKILNDKITSANTNISDLTTTINDLKATSVNGKTTVANAINGVAGTSLSSSTTYTDMAYYISLLKATSNMFANAVLLTSNDPTVTGIKGYIYFGTGSTYTFTSNTSTLYDRFRFMKSSESATSIQILNQGQESLAVGGELGYTSNRYAQFDIVFFNVPVNGTFEHTYAEANSLIYVFY